MTCTLHELSPANGPSFAGPGPLATNPIEGQSYLLVCLAPDTTGYIRQITYQPRLNIVDAATLARQAFRILPLDYPQPSTAPPRTSRQLVGIRTWLWIDPTDYRPVQATVEIPGLAVTATATPSTVRWTMGDDTTITCPGPGTPYDPTRPDNTQQTDCSHVYQRRGTYTITVQIDWTVTWTATDGTSGALPPVTRGVSFPAAVDSRQAVITG